jgi:hypothetical protein
MEWLVYWRDEVYMAEVMVAGTGVPCGVLMKMIRIHRLHSPIYLHPPQHALYEIKINKRTIVAIFIDAAW